MIDDELAKKMGLPDLVTLKDRVREQIKDDFAARQPPASEAPHPGRAGQCPFLPVAARHGGQRIHQYLGPG